MQSFPFAVEYPDYRVTFSRESAGFPTSIVLKLRNQREQAVVETPAPWLHIRTAGNQAIRPHIPADFTPVVYPHNGATCVEFWNVEFVDQNNSVLPQWRLNLRYEFHPEGVGFFSIYFGAMELPLPTFEQFTIRIPMTFDGDVTCGYWNRPQTMDGSTIQAINSFVRNVTEKEERSFPAIVPLIAFDYGETGAISRHIEWMAEGQNALGPDPMASDTHLLWENGAPTLCYDFIREPIQPGDRPCQWRNQFGFALGQTPKVRDKAPLRLYHDLDLFDPFPSDRQIQKMAREGADALILHEGWRTDLQNGGSPRDWAALSRVVRTAHANGIRVALYIRGNELSVREDLASWFGCILQKDYDGLYADYGGPVLFHSVDEDYPGGRFCFKEHYHTMHRLREETIGKDGLFILHTGPFFCGTVLGSVIDAYTSGEGEKGIMLAGRREHAYFSESALGAGSLWTAAFPDYETEKMLPYMANIGQYPHVTLGVQMLSSSLTHPRETGCVTYARPLWKYYGLMTGERNLKFSNDLCDETIRCDGSETGASLFTMTDGAQLLLLSNFRTSTSVCTAHVGPMTAQPGQKTVRLLADEKSVSVEAEPATTEMTFSMELPAYGVGAVLMYPDNGKWKDRLTQFLRPYPKLDQDDLAYRQAVEAMGRLRFEPEASPEQYLQVRIPTQDIGWEDSVWWDLYHSVYEVYITPEHQSRKKIGYICRNGFTTQKPSDEELLWPGQETPPIALHKILPPGETLVELRANHYGEDFYSFVAAVCSSSADMSNPRELTFLSELDHDRARLTFRVNLS